MLLFKAYAQDYPKDYFRSPVDFPIALAGNFGEIRGGHFHAGIDIKTQQVEGKNIYAAADGYVVRIKVSLYGYGKVLYVRHPNGYTTVYAHLQKFNPEIEDYINKIQYAQKKFTVEAFPKAGELTVKKGDVIAISGNTGGSGGPHLHFEIRESGSEIPINPLLFGFDVKDTKPPLLKTLGVYPLNEVSWVNKQNEPQYFKIQKSDDGFSLSGNPKIEVAGKIGFGLEANDYLDAAPNRCGVYSVLLTKNGVPVYQHEMEKIPFDETRFINTHVDYFAWNKNNQRVQRSYLQPYNELSIYKNMLNKGQLFFLSDTTFLMEYQVKDAYLNTSSLKFEITSVNEPISFERASTDSLLFRFDDDNFFSNENVSISIPEGCLYDDIFFHYEEKAPVENAISKVFHIQDLYTPLQDYIWITLPVDSNYFNQSEKVLAVSLDEKNKLLSAEGGKFSNGKISFRTRSFGPYCLMVDTTPPTIKPVNISSGKNMANEVFIQVKIEDDLSGIKTYNGYINGKWELFEFDKKTGLMTFYFNKFENTNGKHQLTIEVTDERRNLNKLEIDFIR